jgi:hypothetical protein
MKRQQLLVASVALLAVATSAAVQNRAPRFEVDPLWPKPLPNRWILGSVVGLTVGAQDRIYVLTDTSTLNKRTEIGGIANPPTGECCLPAPNVLVLDAAGNVVRSFTPAAGTRAPNGIAVDAAGTIWIGGRGGTDTQLLRFSSTGAPQARIGSAADSATIAAATPRPATDTAYTGVSGARPAPQRTAVTLPADNNSKSAFGGPAAVAFDAVANETYVADGYRNSRIAVVDARTGSIKRFWTAGLGSPVTCIEIARDGLVYVCDRANNRIQVFRKSGELVKTGVVAPNTRGNGSVWDIAFSEDVQQRFIYVADGSNMKVHILERATLNEVGSFGSGGRYPGQFYGLHSIAVDSRGNVYTGESLEGKRVQKWVKR